MLFRSVTMYSFTVLFLISSKVLLMDLYRRYGIGAWGLVLYSLAEVFIVAIIYTAILLLVQQNRASLPAKPTSYLSKRLHCLSDLTQIWDLIRRSWAVSLSTMKLSPHCLTAGYAIGSVFGV